MDLKDRLINENVSYTPTSSLILPLQAEADQEREHRKKTILALINQISPSPKEHITLDDHLVDDLEYDSVKLIELSVSLEMEFDLPPISEEASANIATVNDIILLIEMLMYVHAR